MSPCSLFLDRGLRWHPCSGSDCDEAGDHPRGRHNGYADPFRHGTLLDAQEALTGSNSEGAGSARRGGISTSAPNPECAELARPPETIHARHDHGATRSVFLHIKGVAVAHRVTAGIVAGINVDRIRVVVRLHVQTCWRPPDPLLRGDIRGGRPRRCASQPLRRRVLCTRRQRKNASQNDPYCRRPDPHHPAHHRPVVAATSPIAAPRSTAPFKIVCMRAEGALKSQKCGEPRRHPPWPRWKPWRTTCSGACQKPFATCARA